MSLYERTPKTIEKVVTIDNALNYDKQQVKDHINTYLRIPEYITYLIFVPKNKTSKNYDNHLYGKKLFLIKILTDKIIFFLTF